MTSDAKIGLLLGFVFILVIVSLVNGLPGIIGKDSADKGVNTSVPPLDSSYGFDAQASGVVKFFKEKDKIKFPKRHSESDGDSRFSDGIGMSKSGDGGSSDKKSPASNKKFYVVKSGDNLGKIARKVYGNEIGNKQATIDMIFEANSHILKSPDDLSIDQKLIMPSLNGKQENPVIKSMVTEKKPSGPIGKFTKAVKNVFGKKSKRSSLYAVYVVKDGDSLWNIASKKLGSGVRCSEIQKINNSILKGSDDVAPGMQLKIPQK